MRPIQATTLAFEAVDGLPVRIVRERRPAPYVIAVNVAAARVGWATKPRDCHDLNNRPRLPRRIEPYGLSHHSSFEVGGWGELVLMLNGHGAAAPQLIHFQVISHSGDLQHVWSGVEMADASRSS